MRFVRIITILLSVLVWSGIAPAQTAAAPAKQASPKAGAKSDKKAAEPKAADKAPPAMVDINHATAAELKTLPGIGEAYSAAIIRNRPYKNKTQLRSKDVIPPATYEKIKDQVVAKQ